MKKVLYILLLFLCVNSASASPQKDVLYALAKNYAVEMWNQGKNGNPTLAMDRKAYDFYFKHLYDNYYAVYKLSLKTGDSGKRLELYNKVCDLLKWKYDNQEYSHYKKFIKLKQQIEQTFLLEKD